MTSEAICTNLFEFVLVSSGHRPLELGRIWRGKNLCQFLYDELAGKASGTENDDIIRHLLNTFSRINKNRQMIIKIKKAINRSRASFVLL